MSLELQLDIMKVKREGDSLVEEMENYRNLYKHKNPCQEWKKNSWCEHYVRARAKKFKNRVNQHMNHTFAIKKKLIYQKHTSK